MILSLLSRRLACVGILALGFTLLRAGAAQATLIDSFDTAFNAPQSSIVAMDMMDGTAVVNDMSGILGGQREMMLSATGGVAIISSIPGSGTIMQVQGGNTASTKLQLTYDGNGEIDPIGTFNPTGLGGITLNGISFLLRAMSSNPITATIRIFTDDDNVSEAVLVTSATGMGMFETFSIPFTTFNVGAGAAGPADFNNVGAIQIDLDVVGGAALSYDIIETAGSLAVVPEPGSWAMLALGALGTMGYSQFRRRRARAA